MIQSHDNDENPDLLPNLVCTNRKKPQIDVKYELYYNIVKKNMTSSENLCHGRQNKDS